MADDAPQEDQALVGRFTGLSFTVQKQFWGGILAMLQDPSGNELQIVQQPTAA